MYLLVKLIYVMNLWPKGRSVLENVSFEPGTLRLLLDTVLCLVREI